MAKTATSGKTLTSKKTLPPRKAPPSPEGVLSVDEGAVLSVQPEDEALYSKLAFSGEEALSLEKALTFEQMISEESSSGDNTQLHPFPEAAPAKSHTKGKPSSVPKPEEHSLEKKDSSGLQVEAMPGPLENLVQSWGELTTLQEKTPEEETTPREEAPPKAPAQKTPYFTKPAPGPPGTPTLPSPVPQDLTVSKNDKEEVTKLQEEVESLRKALELMGEQLE